ncbi:MAG: hypothetical protein Q4F18_12715 [Clostridia bacterium]|nr:hypothetical protein [Clostridia bacterium]
MSKRMKLEEVTESQQATIKMEAENGSKFNAVIQVKTGWISDTCECTVYIGHGMYDDHNMKNVSILWPENSSIEHKHGIHSSYDCAYTKMRYGGNGLLTIYAGRTTIDINAVKKEETEEQSENDED